MLLLVLTKETDKEVVYNYFPEQGEEYGTITVDKATGNVIDVERASNDKYSRYFGNALARIKKYVANKCYLEKDTVAWY